MTYEQIEQANKKLKLTDIKGKDYAEVAGTVLVTNDNIQIK